MHFSPPHEVARNSRDTSVPGIVRSPCPRHNGLATREVKETAAISPTSGESRYRKLTTTRSPSHLTPTVL
jgi:hypothetical protein